MAGVVFVFDGRAKDLVVGEMVLVVPVAPWDDLIDSGTRGRW